MIDEKYKDVIDLAIGMVPGIQRTGLKVVEMRDRYARAVMPLDGNGSHLGTMYAGALFVLGEFSGGIIHIASFDFLKLVPIVKQVSIEYLKPARTDVSMEVALSGDEVSRVENEVTENGKADLPLSLELKDAEGVTVSRVTGVWQVRTMPEWMTLPSG